MRMYGNFVPNLVESDLNQSNRKQYSNEQRQSDSDLADDTLKLQWFHRLTRYNGNAVCLCDFVLFAFYFGYFGMYLSPTTFGINCSFLFCLSHHSASSIQLCSINAITITKPPPTTRPTRAMCAFNCIMCQARSIRKFSSRKVATFSLALQTTHCTLSFTSALCISLCESCATYNFLEFFE